MTKFKVGDEVRVTEGLLAGETGVIVCPFWQKAASDYPEVIVEFGDGESSFVDIDYVELLEDPYEYQVETSRNGVPITFYRLEDWGTKEDAEALLKTFTDSWELHKVDYLTARLVRRRKAGRIEYV